MLTTIRRFALMGSDSILTLVMLTLTLLLSGAWAALFITQ